ncbi:hypothetical protein QYM36_012126 [Artemia franciscana]|uniref:Uncharacterized protein n=1 Tax=Artemia franciscana TaxID=6661 RepID=A0AA88KZK3_ARTSF|nr:hypothetical protein QYM36_012126 [Artemia franciscana]
MGGRFLAKKKENQSLPKGDQNYGPNCNKPDMNPEEFEIAKADYVAKNMNLDGAKLQEIYKKSSVDYLLEESDADAFPKPTATAIELGGSDGTHIAVAWHIINEV